MFSSLGQHSIFIGLCKHTPFYPASKDDKSLFSTISRINKAVLGALTRQLLLVLLPRNFILNTSMH